jgi:hypothetical protein
METELVATKVRISNGMQRTEQVIAHRWGDRHFVKQFTDGRQTSFWRAEDLNVLRQRLQSNGFVVAG